MDEEDIILLELQGYNFNREVGAITTKEGEYLESVNVGGEEYNSFASRQRYEQHTVDQLRLEEANFEAENATNRVEEEKIFLATADINSMMSNPTASEVIDFPSKAMNNPYYKKAFDDVMKDRKVSNEHFYTDMQDMFVTEAKKEGYEIENGGLDARDAVYNNANYNDIEDPVERKRMAAIDTRLRTIEEADPDVDEKAKIYKEQDKLSMFYFANNGSVIVNPGELDWDNVIDKVKYETAKALTNTAVGIAAMVSPTGTGMQNDRLEEEYIALNKERTEKLIPIAEKVRIDTQTRIEKAQASRDKASKNGDIVDIQIYDRILRKLKYQDARLEDFTEQNLIPRSLGTKEKGQEVFTAGYLEVAESMALDLRIANKLENKNEDGSLVEELTEAEKELFLTYGFIQDTQNRGFKNTFTSEVFEGLFDAGVFIEQMYISGKFATAVSGKVVNKIVKKGVSSAITKYTKTGVELLVEPFASSMTYNVALDSYLGPVRVVAEEGKDPVITVRWGAYHAMQKEIDLQIDEIEKAMPKVVSEEGKKALEGMIKDLNSNRDFIKKPMHGAVAVLKGYTEYSKEKIAETYVGEGFDKIIKKVGKSSLVSKYTNKAYLKWSNTTLGRKLIDNPKFQSLQRGVDNLNNARQSFNASFSHSGGGKVISSVPAEIFEEISTQLTPTIGNTIEENLKQASEVLDPDFSLKVGLITLMLGQSTNIIGGVRNQFNLLTNLTSEERAKRAQGRKDAIEFFTAMRKGESTNEQLQKIFQAAGMGESSMTDFINTIKEAENNGEIAEAEEARRNFAHEQIKAFSKLGKLSEYKRALRKVKIHNKLNQSEMLYVDNLVKEIEAMEKYTEGYANPQEIIDIKSRQRYNNKARERVALALGAINEVEALKELNEKAGTEGKSFSELLNLMDINSYSEITRKYVTLKQSENILNEAEINLNKRLNEVTDFNHQVKFKNEQKYRGKIDRLNSKIFGGKMTAEEFRKQAKENPDSWAKRNMSQKEINRINREAYITLLKAEIIKKQEENFRKFSREAAEARKQEERLNEKIVEDKNKNKNKTKAQIIEEEEKELQERKDKAVEEALAAILKAGATLFADQHNEENYREFKEEMEKETGKVFEDEMADYLPSDDGVQTLIELFKKYVAKEIENGNEKSTFNDWWNHSIASGFVDKSAFSRKQLKLFAEAWEAAGLGVSKWGELWDTHYKESQQNTMKEMFKVSKELLAEMEEEKANEVNDKSELEARQNALNKRGTNPDTGKPNVVTPVAGKTNIISNKVNFSGVVVRDEEVIDGKLVIRSKRDATETPILNNNTVIDTKDLLHPEKNNPGEVWEIVNAVDEGLDLKVKLVDGDGNITKMLFSEWVKQNIKGRKLEDFKNSDEYIGMVPMLYKNKEGKYMAFIPDVARFTPYTIQDDTKTTGEYIEIKNLTMHHKELMEKGREKALELRKKIHSGNVKSAKIVSKKGSPVLEISNTQTAVPVSTASPTSKIVIFNEGSFVDINNEQLGKGIKIINPEVVNTVNSGKTGTYYLSPQYKENGVMHYMAVAVLRKNEHGKNRAKDADIKTAKLVLAAHKALNEKRDLPKYDMTLKSAIELQSKIKKEFGLNIKEKEIAKSIVRGLISVMSYENKKVRKKYPGDKIKVSTTRNGKLVMEQVDFLDALDSGVQIVQNTSFESRAGLAIGVEISVNEDGSFKVEKTEGKTNDESYENFVRSRIHTTKISFNMGTEEAPMYSMAIQPTIMVEYNDTTVEESPQQIEEVKPEVEIETTDEALTEKEEKDLKATVDFLSKLNSLNEESIGDALIAELNDTENLAKAGVLFGNITSIGQKHLVDKAMELITSKFPTSTELTFKEFYSLTEGSFNKKYVDDIKTARGHLANLDALLERFPEDAGLIALRDNLLNTIRDLKDVTNNFEVIFKKAFVTANKKGFIKTKVDTATKIELELEKDNLVEEDNSVEKETIEDTTEEEEENEKNYGQSNAQVVHKNKISSKLKSIFSRIKIGRTGYLGTDLYEDYDHVFNLVSTYLISPMPTDPSFEGMMERLSNLEESHPFMTDLIRDLKAADSETRNGFVSSMYKMRANAKFVNFVKSKNEGLQGEVWDSNANAIKYKIKGLWVDNFKRGDITNGDLVDKEKLKELVKEFESWGEKPWEMADKTRIRKWTEQFGLKFSDASWDELVEGNSTIRVSGKADKVLSFEDLFGTNSLKKGGNKLFTNLYYYALNNSKAKGVLDFTKNNKLIPTNDMSSILHGLLHIEATNNVLLTNVTRMDGGKPASEIVNPSHVTMTVKKLKEDKAYLEKLKTLGYSKNSYLLDLLMTNKQISDRLIVGETGINSLKEDSKKYTEYSKIEDLGELDYMFHQRAMFQHMKEDDIPGRYKGFKMRYATMSTPTNSDKGRMMLLKVPVFDLMGTLDAIEIDAKGNIIFAEDLEELLYEQLILPELTRITEHKGKTRIKGYEKGARRFNAIPSLNSMKNSKGETAVSALSKGMSIEDFKEEFGKEGMKIIKSLIISEAKANLEKDPTEQGWHNTKYTSKDRNTNSKDNKALIAELDYIANSYMTNNNIMQLIAGDPALYFKSDSSPVSDVASIQNKISKDLGVNLGKRLALMIAPGTVGADFHNQEHIQIQMKDKFDMAAGIEQLIEWHYNKEILDKKFGEGVERKTYRAHIQDYRNNIASEEVIDQLNMEFSKLKNYFSIETTDAQEYTTLREHLRLLTANGKIGEEKANLIYDIVYVQKKPLDKNDPDVQMVLQPMKPVYTGSIIKDGVLRTIYIKSSSIPLIPDLFNGTELEPLMVKMKEIEDATDGKRTVRASYQSANKVGAMDNPIDPFEPADLEALTTEKDENGVLTRILVLPSDGLKIQQDVPYKSDKDGGDVVSMGTQIFKLLMGDGIANIEDPIFNGMTGRQLKDKFFGAFSTMINYHRERMRDELLLDENLNPINQNRTIERIQELLIKEGEERGFDINDMKLLDLTETDGKKHFSMPLWMSGNSDKIETMLNAIIVNKIFKQKLPGNSFVVGSETGFTLREQEQAVASVETVDRYSVEDLKNNPDKIYIFGDNTIRKGKGGQAIVRDEENAFGIATKKLPARGDNAYFSDEQYDSNIATIEKDIKAIKADGRTIVFPKDGIGTGLAALKEKAPKTYAYLESRLVEEFNYLNSVGVQPTENAIKKGSSMSQVIHLNGYNGGPLKGNQALLPSKIELNGQIIDLFETDDSGEYIYIVEKSNGGFALNENKIDPELLNNFGFRTPTSSHGSGSNIEVAGFFPAIVGDFLVTSKNLIAQMGQDFDVDKLTTYKYHTYQDKDGKIRRLSKEHTDSEIKSLEDRIKRLEERSSTSEEDIKKEYDMIDALMNTFSDEDFSAEPRDEFVSKIEQRKENLQKMKNKFEFQLAQNDFIEVHNTVYRSKDKRVKRKITKVLSMENAEKQADAIDNLNDTASGKEVNLLSPTYQMDKMISGSTGSTAIGIYAKGVTFNSLVQQLDDPLRLIRQTKNGHVNRGYKIGSLESNGSFGLSQTLSRKDTSDKRKSKIEEFLARSITEVMDERVNTATDNEKAQILGRVGITSIDNIAVDNLLSLLGFDNEITVLDPDAGEYEEGNEFHKKTVIDGKDVYYSQYSIPYLLHSQPIVKEYFKRMSNGQTIISDYNENLEEQILNDLLTRPKNEEDSMIALHTSPANSDSKLTGETLAKGVETGSYKGETQEYILKLYLNLLNDARELKKLQQIVDISSFGRSMWSLKEVIDNFDELKDPMGSYNNTFNAPLSLIGEVNSQGEFKPTTNQGIMINTAIEMGEKLFFDYFPYKNTYVSGIIEGIVDTVGKKTGKVKLREIIFKEIKKYLSSSNLGVNLGNPDTSRQDLFFSNAEHISLSNYVGEHIYSESTEEGIKALQSNIFLTSLTYKPGVNKKPDLILYDNTETGNLVEEDLHSAFRELFVKDLPLPPKNGRPYSTKKLAQELVSYSFLSGNIVPGAVGFHKFIPIEYYKDLRIEEEDGTIKTGLELIQELDTEVTEWDKADTLKNFETQFFQNNPDLVPDLPKGISFARNTEGGHIRTTMEVYPAFVTRKKSSKNKHDKYTLYKNIEGTSRYEQIDVAGEFGMSEYSPYENSVVSAIIENHKKRTGIFTAPLLNFDPAETTPIDIKEGDKPLDILDRIAKGNHSLNPSVSNIAATMVELFKDKDLGLEVKIVGDKSIRGDYYKGVLSINLNQKDVAEAFLHEFVHAVTSDYINDYINKDGSLKDNAPQDVIYLQEIFQDYRNKIIATYPKEHAEFEVLWKEFQANKKRAPHEKVPVDFSVNPKNTSLFYATVNLKEFLAVPLSNNKVFLEETAKLQYKKTSLTIFQKFSKTFQRIINTVAGKENTLGTDLITDALSFVSSRAAAMPSTPKVTPLNEIKAGMQGAGIDFSGLFEGNQNNDAEIDFSGFGSEIDFSALNDAPQPPIESYNDINFEAFEDGFVVGEDDPFGDALPAEVTKGNNNNFLIVKDGSKLKFNEEEIKFYYDNYKSLMGRKREGFAMDIDKFKNLIDRGQVIKVGDSLYLGQWKENHLKILAMSSPSLRSVYTSLQQIKKHKINITSSATSDLGIMWKKMGLYKTKLKHTLKGEGKWKGVVKTLYATDKALVESIFDKKIGDITNQDYNKYDNIVSKFGLGLKLEDALKNNDTKEMRSLLVQAGVYDYSAYKMAKKYTNSKVEYEDAIKRLRNETYRRSNFNVVDVDKRDLLNSTEVRKKLDTDLNKTLARYLSKFGFTVGILEDTQNNMGIDSMEHLDILNKIARVKEGNIESYPEQAGEAIAFMMQYNPLVTEILGVMKKLPGFSKKGKTTNEYLKDIGVLIAEELHNQTNTKIPKSLSDKIKGVIDSFLNLINKKRLERVNNNISKIASMVLTENANFILANPSKPGKNKGEVSRLSFDEAIKEDEFGASIIEKLGPYFMLTGSTSLAEQGTIYRPEGNPLHDIDWVSTLPIKETLEIFNKEYPENKKVRTLYNKDKTSRVDTFIIVPPGHEITNYRLSKDSRTVNFDISKDGEVVSTYLPKLDSFSGEVEGKLIDFFTGNSDRKAASTKEINGSFVQLADWEHIFAAKLEYARIKDIWDYNRYIPKNRLAIIESFPNCK